MSRLSPSETELVGQWVERDGKAVGDATCERIDELTNGGLDVVQDHPRQGGWVRLYRDRLDGRFWERSYPQGELHGGGPPTLRCISADEVQREYDFQPEKLRVTIYMPLLNEGVEVWRPVEGTPLSADTYRVEGDVPDDEEWAFAPGSVVRCEPRTLSDGERMAAVALAD